MGRGIIGDSAGEFTTGFWGGFQNLLEGTLCKTCICFMPEYFRNPELQDTFLHSWNKLCSSAPFESQVGGPRPTLLQCGGHKPWGPPTSDSSAARECGSFQNCLVIFYSLEFQNHFGHGRHTDRERAFEEGLKAAPPSLVP